MLSEAKKRQVLREAHTQLTDTIRLFENMDNKFAKELVETYLMDLRQRIEQLLELPNNRIMLENADEVCERTEQVNHELTYEQYIRKKTVIKSLERCNIPQQEWRFHLENPEASNWDKSPHLNMGIKAVLSAYNYNPPPCGLKQNNWPCTKD